MNIIQSQADEFILYHMRENNNYRDFIDKIRSVLYDYKKTTHKIEFVERVIQKAKIEFDEHLLKCTDLNECSINKFYENTLFFLQEELEELESQITALEFSSIEKQSINESLQKILDDINLLKLGQELTYDDFKEEFEELKDLYYLKKKNWVQLFVGKLTDMVVSGVIKETVGKEIIEIIKSNYKDLIVN